MITAGRPSYNALVQIAIKYTFPDTPPGQYDDFDVTLTYYDVDNDCITIASTEELVDAIQQFSEMNPPVVRITTDVKRKKNRPIPSTPPRASSSRASSPASSPQSNNGANRTTVQLQTILESFVSILATAVVALQGHINPTPPVAAAAAQPPTTLPVAPATEQSKSATEEEPKENSNESRPFIHGRHTCDRCLCTPIVGKRFHAINLPDYDLCEKCKDGYKGTEIQFEAAELGKFAC